MAQRIVCTGAPLTWTFRQYCWNCWMLVMIKGSSYRPGRSTIPSCVFSGVNHMIPRLVPKMPAVEDRYQGCSE